jgi:hypothetical protein
MIEEILQDHFPIILYCILRNNETKTSIRALYLILFSFSMIKKNKQNDLHKILFEN